MCPKKTWWSYTEPKPKKEPIEDIVSGHNSDWAEPPAAVPTKIAPQESNIFDYYYNHKHYTTKPVKKTVKGASLYGSSAEEIYFSQKNHIYIPVTQGGTLSGPTPTDPASNDPLKWFTYFGGPLGSVPICAPKQGDVTQPQPAQSKSPAMWTLEGAKQYISWFQKAARKYGYHLCLGGSVLNTGSSDKDLDLYFLPLGNHTPTNPTKLVSFLEVAYGKLEPIGNNYPGTELPYAFKGKMIGYHHNPFLPQQRIDVFIMGTKEDSDKLAAIMPILVELEGLQIEHPKAAGSPEPIVFKGKPAEYDDDIPF